MNIPVPDLFRYYGQIMSGEDGASFRVFATLAGVVLFVLVWFFVGALVESIGRLWNRSKSGSALRSPSAPFGSPDRKGDRHSAYPR